MKRKQSKPKPATVHPWGLCSAFVKLYGELIASLNESTARVAARRINRILAKREKELGRG